MEKNNLPILLDTSFFVALGNKDDDNYSRANDLLQDLLEGKWGTRITTDYILDEAITVTWFRTKRKDLVKQVYEYFVGSEAICLLQPFTKEFISEAWKIFEKYSDKTRPLSFTDCTLLAHSKQRDIPVLLSFDSEFDGLITRIH